MSGPAAGRKDVSLDSVSVLLPTFCEDLAEIALKPYRLKMSIKTKMMIMILVRQCIKFAELSGLEDDDQSLIFNETE